MQSHTPSIVQTTQGQAPVPALDQRAGVTLQHAAKLLDISVSSLYRVKRAGKLRFFKVGGRTLVCTASMRALVNADAA